MDENDSSLDLTGIGKLASSIPESAWRVLVSTATRVVENLLSPATEFTGGVGRLIRQKFDNMVEVEKVLLADGLEQAVKKARKRGKPISQKVNISSLVKTIEETSRANEPELRELWTSLLSRELTDEKTHPEFASLLSRMTSSEAKALIEVSQIGLAERLVASMRRNMAKSYPPPPTHLAGIFSSFTRRFDFSKDLLVRMNLINNDHGYFLTDFGKAFLEAVGEIEDKPDEDEDIGAHTNKK